jgi:hypothetical protein
VIKAKLLRSKIPRSAPRIKEIAQSPLAVIIAKFLRSKIASSAPRIKVAAQSSFEVIKINFSRSQFSPCAHRIIEIAQSTISSDQKPHNYAYKKEAHLRKIGFFSTSL